MEAQPQVERDIALDLVKHGLLIAPVVILVAGLVSGWDGTASIVRIPRAELHRLGGAEMFKLRDRVIPLQHLSRMFGLSSKAAKAPQPTAAPGDLTVVILGSAEKRTGIAVDRLLGQEETVVKPLGTHLGHIAGLSGATISGDGQVRLILDPAALVDTAEEVA